MKSKGEKKARLDEIIRNPLQPRKDFDDEGMQEIAQSIKTYGVIQPVLVRKMDDGYQLIAGERRLRAAQMAGLEEIPINEVEAEGIEIAEISLVENLQRRDLNPVEESEALSVLSEKLGMRQEEMAERIGKSRSYIANIMRIKNLPESIKTEIKKGRITLGHAKAILGTKDEKTMLELCNKIVKGTLNVRQAERLAGSIVGKRDRKGEGKRLKKTFGNGGIFYNKLKGMIGEIRRSGGKVEVVEREDETHYEVVIRIAKGVD